MEKLSLGNENEASFPENEEISKKTLIQKIEYKDYFKLNSSNFLEWFEELNRYLFTKDYDEYINKNFSYK
ncbi:hypothetical protein H8356DRAFT_1327375 [Neocallimastix lanati (nom. inval.)]|nr:hypothetical protein H8356DRAFT_1327375 [Neocallimastix sp. JGI-2020a]